jgi:hypothetical protein
MNLIKHFIIRDFKDTSVTWIILILLIVFRLFSKVSADHFSDFSILAYALFFFFIIQLNQVWSGAFGRSIAREYLLTLPVSRTTLFGIMWIRSLVGALPLAIFVYSIRIQLQNQFQVESNDAIFIIWEVGLLAQILAIFTIANNSQADLMIGAKKKRYIGFLKHIVTLAVDSSFALLWCLAFYNKMVPVFFTLLSMAYFIFKLRIAYIKWLWGDEARVFKKR